MAKTKSKIRELITVSTITHSDGRTFLSIDLQWVSFMLNWQGFLMQTDKRLLIVSPLDKKHKFVYRRTDGN